MTAALRKAALAGEWMTRPEVAAVLDLSPKAVSRRAADGYFPDEHMSRTPGNHRRWRRSYIMSLPEARATASLAGSR